MKKSRIKIKHYGLLIILSLLIYSCGQSKNWLEKDKKGFVSGCMKANQARASEEQANLLCNCMLNKIMKKNITNAEIKKMKQEEVKKIALSCISSEQKKMKKSEQQNKKMEWIIINPVLKNGNFQFWWLNSKLAFY